MKVHKFGGSSLKSLAGLLQCVDVIQSYSEKESTWAVVSALYGVTNQLIEARQQAERGESAKPVIQEIAALHQDYLASIAKIPEQDLSHFQTLLDELLEQTQDRLEGIRLLKECPDYVQAELLGVGEQLSALLFEAAMRGRGLDLLHLPHHQALVADGTPLDAVVDQDASSDQLAGQLDHRPAIVLTPGFIACNKQGRLVNLGRNGSDYSAACLAVAIGAERCIIWKEIDGIYSANPEIVPDARRLPAVSYAEALELSYFGAKVIGAKAIGPMMSAGLPCEIRDVNRPDRDGTLISDATDASIKGISHLDGIAILTISGSGLRGQVGMARRVFDALVQQDISIVFVVQSSSEYSISLAVQQTQLAQAKQALEKEFHFERMHQLINPLESDPNRSIISLVGDGMWHQRGVAARLLTAVSAAGINVEAIAQGPSERAIALAVKADDAALAVHACHDAFFAEAQHLDVVLLGCGNVGAVLLDQIRRQEGDLEQQHIAIRVCAIANSRSVLVSKRGIKLDDWSSQLEQKGKVYQLEDLLGLKAELGLTNPTMIDCTASKALARRYPEFISAGYNVVAANKHANTLPQEDYRELRRAARRRLRKFLYETNVGAGLPVIDTLHSLIRSGDQLIEFKGILSGSLSLIFGLLQDGMSFSEAVASARAKGFTEPDPREDLSGQDVARKLLIIAREVGMELELDDVVVEPVIPMEEFSNYSMAELEDAFAGLDDSFRQLQTQAEADNAVLRYVAEIVDGQCRVRILAVTPDDPMYAIRDGENALALLSQYYQPIPMVLRGYGAGAEVTAAGIFGDLLRTLWRPLDQ